VRKCLGVLAGTMVLYVVSWAQAPAPAPPPDPASRDTSSQTPASQTPDTSAPAPQPPPQPPASETTSSSIPLRKQVLAAKFPLLEFFGGYSFAQAGYFNSGRWAQLNGWNGSLAVNVASWLGLLADGGQHFGTSQIPTGTPKPFPTCGGIPVSFCPGGTYFNVRTQAYEITFGAQFPYRKHELLTPFGELMVGHGGVRGDSTAQGVNIVEVSSGLALIAGAGVDRKINERFALRVKVDYLQTRTDFPVLGKAKQDNLRVSVGVVIRSVKKKKRKLEEETPPVD
jgi:hypothetical protein